MIKNDIVTGAVLAAGGAWLAIEARTFPTLGGMTHGPGLFPTIAGAGLVICGLMVLATGLLQTAPDEALDEAPAEAFQGNLTKARVNTAAVILGVIFFALFLDRLGFHLVAFPLMLVLLLLFGIQWWKALLLAVGITTLVHLIFYSFLHVPLPWGLLEPIAW